VLPVHLALSTGFPNRSLQRRHGADLAQEFAIARLNALFPGPQRNPSRRLVTHRLQDTLRCCDINKSNTVYELAEVRTQIAAGPPPARPES